MTGFVLMAAFALTEDWPWTSWILVVVWLGIAFGGVDNLRKARRRLRAFDAEHGVGAGEQTVL